MQEFMINYKLGDIKRYLKIQAESSEDALALFLGLYSEAKHITIVKWKTVINVDFKNKKVVAA